MSNIGEKYSNLIDHYDEIEREHNNLSDDYYNLENKYTKLINKYTKLIKEYNKLFDEKNEILSLKNEYEKQNEFYKKACWKYSKKLDRLKYLEERIEIFNEISEEIIEKQHNNTDEALYDQYGDCLDVCEDNLWCEIHDLSTHIKFFMDLSSDSSDNF